jgi:hypothetical protein
LAEDHKELSQVGMRLARSRSKRDALRGGLPQTVSPSVTYQRTPVRQAIMLNLFALFERSSHSEPHTD